VFRDEDLLQAEQLSPGTPRDRYCDAGRLCGKESTDVRATRFPLAAGKYVFRYTCTVEGSLVATNRITLW
jgi:hypothetical protein